MWTREKLPIFAISLLALGLGVTAGWALGSWSTCGRACGFDLNLMEAIGAWVGAIGGVAIAVVGGLYTFFTERENRAKAERAEKEHAREVARKEYLSAHDAALQCTLRVLLQGTDIGGYPKLTVFFKNRSTEMVRWPVISFDGSGELPTMAILRPGGEWTHPEQLRELGISIVNDHGRARNKSEIEEDLDVMVRSTVAAEFDIHGYCFRRTLDGLAYLGERDVGSNPADGRLVAGTRPAIRD